MDSRRVHRDTLEVDRCLRIRASPPGIDPGFGVDAETLETSRTFGWRYVARAQANLNIRVSRLWLYSRTTVFIRCLDFVEDDTFRDIRVEDEYSIEQATATR